MNIINRSFLKLALLPSGFYNKMGVNLKHLEIILQTKLLLDDRRPSAIAQTRKQKKEKNVNKATIGTMMVSAVMGLLYLFAFAIGKNEITKLTVYLSMFFVMLSATLISDFTSVLIDVRDNYIILPRPVNDRTVLIARLLHIFIHICKIVLPMSIPGFIYIATQYTILSALYFLLLILFVTLFAIFFINAVYILILRITTPQRFQSIISYIQILFAIIIYASYQILPRISRQMQDVDFNRYKAMLFVPIYWFAGSWNLIYTLQANTTGIIFTLLTFFLPVFSLFIVVKYLAPSFNNKLALIHSNAAATTPGPKTGAIKKEGYSHILSRLLTKTPAERMGFLFTWKMTARSRDFKLKVYPSMGYFLVYVVILFIQTRDISLEELTDQQGKGKFLIISALYFTSLILIMAMNQIVYSEKYKASWIYYVTPVNRPGEIINGGIKAAIFKFYIPIVLIIFVAGLAFIGPVVIPNLILGLFNELLIVTMIAYVNHKQFPFSMHQNLSVKAGSFLRNLGVYLISGLIATIHYFIYSFMPVVLICCVMSIIATWLLMSSIKELSWAAIKSSYAD